MQFLYRQLSERNLNTSSFHSNPVESGKDPSSCSIECIYWLFSNGDSFRGSYVILTMQVLNATKPLTDVGSETFYCKLHRLQVDNSRLRFSLYSPQKLLRLTVIQTYAPDVLLLLEVSWPVCEVLSRTAWNPQDSGLTCQSESLWQRGI